MYDCMYMYCTLSSVYLVMILGGETKVGDFGLFQGSVRNTGQCSICTVYMYTYTKWSLRVCGGWAHLASWVLGLCLCTTLFLSSPLFISVPLFLSFPLFLSVPLFLFVPRFLSVPLFGRKIQRHYGSHEQFLRDPGLGGELHLFLFSDGSQWNNS